KAAAGDRIRRDRRADFARKVGLWVRWTVRIALGAIYVGVVGLAGYFLSSNLPLALVAGIAGVAVFLTAIDWLLHVDGFALAKAAEAWAIGKVVRWLESFESED